MGRELRRKQAKREGKSLQQEETIEKNQIVKLITITCFLGAIICLVYVLAGVFLTKEFDWVKSDEDTTNTPTTNVENSILAAEIFKQKEEEYYVYFYDFDEEEFSKATTIVSGIKEAKVYKVNTNSGMNSKYVGDITNRKAKTLEELKVQEHTLIKISGDKIVKFYVEDEITTNIK